MAAGVVTFENLPSPQEFESQIESQNIPAVFRGCIKHWKAFSDWNPSNNGLDYLQERVGTAVVEAMLSKSGSVFKGDLRSHEMVPFPFSRFITMCKQNLENTHSDSGVSAELDTRELLESTDDDLKCQVYLAQVPILNSETKERSQIAILWEDIELPTILELREIAAINLWMNNGKSRSSTHYDPHHNLLCVVSGCKRVVLWPPSASPLLYPMPIYGESSNHSSVDIENPDYSLHTRAKHSMEYAKHVTVYAGDVLFIPEGWFHQVDSDDLTIAINYWWQSRIMSTMSEHMDAYYLRRILKSYCGVHLLFLDAMTDISSNADAHGRLVNNEMNRMLDGTSLYNGKIEKHQNEKIVTRDIGYQRNGANDNSGTQDARADIQSPKKILHQLKPHSLHALHELVSLVHASVNAATQSQPLTINSADSPAVSLNGEREKISSDNSFHMEDDVVAYIFWTLEALELQNVLLAMVHNFPRTLEALILHVLSPVGAEILTRRFEELDKLITIEERNEFYLIFYGVFDDQFAAMNSILNGKESFALEAFRTVLDKYMGVNFDRPKQ